MDIGVGSFVFSSGLVSSRKPQTSVFKQIYTAIRASASILALGIVRTVLTKNLEYQVSK
jgi:glucosaminylphosphatidylinositol acyltransferase